MKLASIAVRGIGVRVGVIGVHLRVDQPEVVLVHAGGVLVAALAAAGAAGLLSPCGANPSAACGDPAAATRTNRVPSFIADSIHSGSDCVPSAADVRSTGREARWARRCRVRDCGRNAGRIRPAQPVLDPTPGRGAGRRAARALCYPLRCRRRPTVGSPLLALAPAGLRHAASQVGWAA